MNATHIDFHTNGHATETETLEPALHAARELAHRLASIPHDSPEAQHPSCSVARALAFTMIDMLEEIRRETDGRPASSQTRPRQSHERSG